MAAHVTRHHPEADPAHEGMIPGTASLSRYLQSRYLQECNRAVRAVATDRSRGRQSCITMITCLELCLDLRPCGSKALKFSVTEIERSIKGCPSCRLLRDGFSLCKPDFPRIEALDGSPDRHLPGFIRVPSEARLQPRRGANTSTHNEKVVNTGYG
jgi:hypothetical protein